MKPGEALVNMMIPSKFNIKNIFKPRIAIVGAGIIGLSTAVRTLEKLPGYSVELIAEKFSPNTTGDGSAGFWNPFLIKGLPDEKLKRWCLETFAFLSTLSQTSKGPSLGVAPLSAIWVSSNPLRVPTYSDVFYNYHEMSPSELERIAPGHNYGHFFTTLSIECKRLLPWLLSRFQALGGKVIHQRVDSFSQLASQYDVVVVCTGVESKKFVGDDEVYPIRGQVFKVKAPWVKIAMISDHFHILPNIDTVTLGGTKQTDNWSIKPDPKDSTEIWNGCTSLMPSLKNAEVLGEWVGLRPGRSSPRLEQETLNTDNGKSTEVIYHYGHGGSGVTLFWGSSGEASTMIYQAVHKMRSQYAAKL